MKLVATIALASLALYGGPGHAQDDQRPKDFFDQNYVNRDTVDGREIALPKAPATPTPQSKSGKSKSGTPTKPKGELEPTPEDDWLRETGGPAVDPTPEAAAELENKLENGTPILSVGAILNRADVNHFEQALEKLVSMAERTKAKLGTIFVTSVGPNFSPDFRKLQLRLMMAGGRLRYGANKPDLFKVKKSPSWLIETKEGVIVIEGAPDIGRYVNNKGEFVAPIDAPASSIEGL